MISSDVARKSVFYPVAQQAICSSGKTMVDDAEFSERVSLPPQHIGLNFIDCVPTWNAIQALNGFPAVPSVDFRCSPNVKVLLSGEGGDEAFAGYSNYRSIVWMERLKQICPVLNSTMSWGLWAINSLVHSTRLAKYGPLFSAPFPEYYYSRTSTPYRYSGNSIGELYAPEFMNAVDREYTVEPIRKLFSAVRDNTALEQMLYIDTKTWLPDDLLIKADKMTMANSLELRVPLLDHRLLEFAASLPSHYKLNGFTLKYIWKKALSQRVPKPILRRKKTGFPVPYETWFRNEFRDTIREILDDRRTVQRGYFRRKSIETLINANHEHGVYSKEIFSLITLELWHRMFLDQKQAGVN